ncbi:MAG: UDP-N-acetylglucosamine 2-epimerase (non-hydrolyzing) [Cyclobacteriaceae bacterium]|nr:UDP-N-acetylglucosamine 2-epimerase (non-hydrolyzing) [Cyclobacteriaceae bacterium]
MAKIVTVLGARPQFIKAATVSRALRETGAHEVIVHTGQHHDHNMSEVFFREMDIPHPDRNLGISGLGHGAMTGRMLEEIENVLLQEKPSCVLVYGDTNSTLAGALAAAKLHIPVAHVEAGLRSFEMKMPEEVNRILTDRVSQYLFCPTQTAVDNLGKEGFGGFGCEISQPGDVMYDAVLFYKQKVPEMSTVMDRLGIAGTPFTLATLHRAENTDHPERLRAICGALGHIHQHARVILPLHPRTKGLLQKHNITLGFPTIDPVGYFDMLALLEGCQLVLTDSGGLQKEAYFFSKYCITLRDQTEWVELVQAGANFIVGADRNKITGAYDKVKGKRPNTAGGLYGDGTAAQTIARRLASI